MYNKIILDHFKNPRNHAVMKNPSATGMGASSICGDVMTLYLQIHDQKIDKASFTTVGCGAAIASGSMLTEMLKGQPVSEAKKINSKILTDAIGGLPAIKMHCPDLALEALKAALKEFEKNGSRK